MTSMFNSASNTLITGGTFSLHNHGIRESSDALRQATATAAFHNSDERFDPPKYHAKTRLTVLSEIMKWIKWEGDLNSFIIWVYGPAGTGKSAIAQTIAEMCEEEMILLASFFFSRNDPSRSSVKPLIATIAYQITLNLPDVRDAILGAVERDPLILSKSLAVQLKSLIVEPLQPLIEAGFFNAPTSRRLVIIDGLDECSDPRAQCNILEVLANAQRQHQLPLILLFTSRPEQHISLAFSTGALLSVTTRIALDKSYLPDKDVQLFLTDKFQEIKSAHQLHAYIPPQWALPDVLLFTKSSGQFIYASTIINYVSSIRHKSQDRLDIDLDIRPPERIAPNTGLALNLDSPANLRQPIDKSTSVYVLEDTPENREAIKAGKVVPAKQLVASDQTPLTIPGGDMNMTINDFSRPSSMEVADAVKDLQNFLASDTVKNLMNFFGPSQLPSLSPSSGPTLSVYSLTTYKATNFSLRGFPTGFFRIRASGSQYYWSLRGYSTDCDKDGNPIVLWPFVAKTADQQTFFINSVGALCCQKGDGFALDLIGNALAITHNRPVTLPWPNPWSHPLPIFSYSHETKIISVEPRVDPLVSLAWPRPDNQWKDRESVVSARCPMNVTIPNFDQIVQWAPNASYSSKWTNYWGTHRLALERDSLGIEDKKSIGSTDQERVMWEIEMVV